MAQPQSESDDPQDTEMAKDLNEEPKLDAGNLNLINKSDKEKNIHLSDIEEPRALPVGNRPFKSGPPPPKDDKAKVKGGTCEVM